MQSNPNGGNGGEGAQEAYYRKIVDIVLYCFDNLPTTKSFFRRNRQTQHHQQPSQIMPTFKRNQARSGINNQNGGGTGTGGGGHGGVGGGAGAQAGQGGGGGDQLLSFWIGFIAWKLHEIQRHETCFEELLRNSDVTLALLGGAVQAASKPPWESSGMGSGYNYQGSSKRNGNGVHSGGGGGHGYGPGGGGRHHEYGLSDYPGWRETSVEGEYVTESEEEDTDEEGEGVGGGPAISAASAAINELITLGY